MESSRSAILTSFNEVKKNVKRWYCFKNANIHKKCCKRSQEWKNNSVRGIDANDKAMIELLGEDNLKKYFLFVLSYYTYEDSSHSTYGLGQYKFVK